MSKYGVFSGLYFLVFSPNAGKYEPEKTPHLDTFHAVVFYQKAVLNNFVKLMLKHLIRATQSIFSTEAVAGKLRGKTMFRSFLF